MITMLHFSIPPPSSPSPLRRLLQQAKWGAMYSVCVNKVWGKRCVTWDPGGGKGVGWVAGVQIIPICMERITS